jgi:hypothetical protein
MTFYSSGAGGSQAVREGSLRWWYGFNALVSARDGRRRNKVLPKDEAEATSTSWLNGKEA